ncbi:MAG: nif-specific transcriptional activator NifA [Spirochaetes bacterium]|nr:MAG: nif-specific transcriptional activator NifA [Spirochaetota bacterium]
MNSIDISENKTNSKKEEIKELTLLLEISRILDSSIDLRDILKPVLETLARHTGILRGIITLYDRQRDEITIETAFGLTKSEKKRGRYKPGEGITGRVFKTGRAAVIKRISDEPEFLDKTGSRRRKESEISFICVPIKLENRVIGTLSIDVPVSPEEKLEELKRLCTIICSMISQAVKLRQFAIEEREKLLEENKRLQEELQERYNLKNIIGNSNEMHEVYRLINQVSRSDTTVLIRGESGTGKELVAHAIHFSSLRAHKPFIKVNCASLPESLIESELFGHEKGAFTGAVTMRKGRFELADGGTIFLDEIGDLSPNLQAKLLRVLQEKEFERVGGTRTIRVDVRVIAATNRNLEEMIEKKLFREDLYYRLNVFPIHLPPLRERKSDILLLADFFVEKYSKIHRKNIKRISTPAIDMMMSYHWPGNVRELENCIERAVLLSEDGVIHGHHLPPTLQTAEESGTTLKGTLKETLERVEKEMIMEALKSSRGNMAEASRILGITERIMGLRVKKYRIDPSRFKIRISKSNIKFR